MKTFRKLWFAALAASATLFVSCFGFYNSNVNSETVTKNVSNKKEIILTISNYDELLEEAKKMDQNCQER